jgi:hypothetical protein
MQLDAQPHAASTSAQMQEVHYIPRKENHTTHGFFGVRTC